MKLVPLFENEPGAAEDALRALERAADEAGCAPVCRVRKTLDSVLIVYPDPSMYRLCSAEERIDHLYFREAEAMMSLCGRPLLTFEKLLEYRGREPVIVHFRGFRPSAWILRRLLERGCFRLGTDSAEQLAAIADSCPELKPVGFACHVPTALRMIGGGAKAVVLYGRELGRYAPDELALLRADGVEVFAEYEPKPSEQPGDCLPAGDALGLDGLVLPLGDVRRFGRTTP